MAAVYLRSKEGIGIRETRIYHFHDLTYPSPDGVSPFSSSGHGHALPWLKASGLTKVLAMVWLISAPSFPLSNGNGGHKILELKKLWDKATPLMTP